MRKQLDFKSGCTVEVTLHVIGGVWKPLILFHLLTGKKRFMQLQRRVPNATQRMLTLQLRELEADGVIHREVFPEVPPRVEYELTEFGRTLEPVLLMLRDWGAVHMDALRPAEGDEIREVNRCKPNQSASAAPA
ncbi:transcriptional regulator, HxlR family [Pseudoxanthomonas sp. GM95]|uniref:winged helix-turn-helix transcriptional regulator n=1 Tax=Pseudoxanthomonas sp. GM95 TaxID=1881043 RepID=UPI0008BAB3A4|nr:helix-turn-helix domain-containing protein [Pseudoxanthomonas sp. GM95]SEM56649.1 transcriptional regulator, HxlR family [Pseudoxanthomonas sp. GM95]